MRGRLRNPLLVCGIALTLAGCGGGGDGTIPPSDAENLLNQLEAVQNDVQSGDCDTAAQHTQEFIAGVNALPKGVDPQVESELTKAADNLRTMVSDPTECAIGTTGNTGLETTDTTATDTTDTETTAPETTVTETTTPEEETTTQEEPAEQPPAPTGGGNEGGDQGGGDTSPPPSGGEPSQSGGLEVPSGGGNG
jgi:hypothetical protein